MTLAPIHNRKRILEVIELLFAPACKLFPRKFLLVQLCFPQYPENSWLVLYIFRKPVRSLCIIVSHNQILSVSTLSPTRLSHYFSTCVLHVSSQTVMFNTITYLSHFSDTSCTSRNEKRMHDDTNIIYVHLILFFK